MLIPPKSFIVSCQSEGNDPFNSPTSIALFAKAAEMGGAHGIRAEGETNIREILKLIKIPIIGLIKSNFPDGTVRITGSMIDVQKILDTGCNIIAIDGTQRIREKKTGPHFISDVKSKFRCMIMADISTISEALKCEDAGADYISTTLNGYTPGTYKDNNGKPNFKLIKEITSQIKIPAFAEGRISTLEQAKKLIELGVSGVIIGTFITRPRVITQTYVDYLSL